MEEIASADITLNNDQDSASENGEITTNIIEHPTKKTKSTQTAFENHADDNVENISQDMYTEDNADDAESEIDVDVLVLGDAEEAIFNIDYPPDVEPYVTVISHTVIQQNPLHKEFAKKVLSSFLTFFLFVIPALFGMAVAMVTEYNNTPGEHSLVEEIKFHLMIVLLGTAAIIALPFHLLALTDLDVTVQDILEEKEDSNNDLPDTDESALVDSLLVTG